MENGKPTVVVKDFTTWPARMVVRSEDTSPVEWHTPLTHMQAAQDGLGQFPNLRLGVAMIQREGRRTIPERQDPHPNPKQQQQQAQAIHLKKGIDACRPIQD